MACPNQATYIVTTDYGKYLICGKCNNDFHMKPLKVHKMVTTEKCQCEHYSHTLKLPVDSDGID